jgi:hypothetical protein
MSLIYSGNTVTGYTGTFSGNVIIPSGVTAIGNAAFQGCTSLTTISLPSTLTSIEDNAFWGSGLTSITIPSSVTSFGELVFNICSDLSSVVFATGSPITTIPRYTFNGCSSLKSVTFPANVTTIGEAAFSSCASLISLTLPPKVTTLGNFCFYATSNMTTIVLDPSLTIISPYCFAACTSLQTHAFPVGLTTIGDYAYNQCNALTSVRLPTTVSSFGIGAFSSCGGLQSAYIDCSATVLPNQTFNGCVNLTTVFLPSSIQTIGDSAFGSCYKLAGMSFPSGIVTIGDYAFYQDVSLAYLSMPTTLRSIGDHCFSGCTSLANLSLPVGLETVKDWAFQGCSTFTDVTIPSTVTTMGTQVFNSCTGLRTAYLDLSMDGIPDYTFTLCSNLVNLRITSNIQFVGVGAFGGCSKLLYVGMPNSVTEIKDYAFVNCDKLSFVSLNSGLLTIGDHSFSGCSSILNIVIPSTVTTIKEWAFGSSTSIRTVTIPSSVTTLQSHVFAGCTSLTSIYFEGNAPSSFGVNVVGSTIPMYYKPTATGWGGVSGYNKISSTATEDVYGGLTQSSLASQLIIPVVSDTTNKITFSSSDLSGVTLMDANATAQQRRERVIAVTKYLLSTLLQVQQGKDVILDTSSLPFPTQITASKIQIAPAGANISSTVLNSGYAVYSPLDTDGDTLTLQSSAGPIVVTRTSSGTGYTASENETVYNVSEGDIRTFGGIQYIIGSVASQKTGINNNLVISQSYSLLYGTTDNTDDTIIGYDGSINGILSIPSGIRYIGNNAFFNARGVTGLVLPLSLNQIGSNAFNGTKITSLDMSSLNNGIDSDSFVIKSQAFANCSELTTVIFPEHISGLYDNVFMNCTSLTSTNYPPNYDIIPAGFFQYCTQLPSIIFTSDITNIYPYAFIGCSSMEYISFAGDAPSIGAYSIPTTTVIKYHGSTTNGWEFFKANYPAYTYVDLDDPANGFQLELDQSNTTVLGYSGEIPASITIPEGVTSIDNGVFMGTAITSVSLPSTLTQIGNETFKNTQLTSIVLPEGLISIGISSFENAPLTSIIFPSTLDIISTEAFKGTSITSVDLSGCINGIAIYNGAFSYCSSLVSVIIPSETVLWDSVFSSCQLFTTMTCTGTPPTIDVWASTNEVTVRYHGNITGWEQFVTDYEQIFIFENLDATENVFTLTYSTTDTTDDTITGFTGSVPTTLVIPSGVKYIGDFVFQDQSVITGISLPTSLVSIGEGAFNNTSLSGSITIPNYVTTIGQSGFSACAGITSVSLSSRLTSISASLFSGCSGLTSITIPSSVTSIGDFAFVASGLTTMTFNGNAPTIGNNSIPNNSTIRYRGNTKNGWTTFISENSGSGFNFVNLDENNSGGNNQMSAFTVPILANYQTTADISLNEATETVDICDALITFRTSGSITKAQADAIFSYDWFDNDVTKVYCDGSALKTAMDAAILDGLRTWVGEKYESDVEQSTATPLGSRVEIDSGMVAGLRQAVADQISDESGNDVLLSLFRQAPQLFPKYQTLSVPAADASFNASETYSSSEDASGAALDFSVDDKFYLVAKLRVSPSAVAKIDSTVAVDASSGVVPDQDATNSFDRIFKISTTNIVFGDISGNPIVSASAAGETMTDFQEYYVKITVTVSA